MKRTVVAAAVAAAIVVAPTTAPQAQDVEAELAAMIEQTNLALLAEGANYRLGMIEYIAGPDQVGGTVIAKDVGNKQLSADFVANDTRRTWSGLDPNTIEYAIDTVDGTPVFGGLTGAETDAAIVRAMDTWTGVKCSDLGLARNPDFGLDLGYIAFLFGLGGSPFIVGDVMHAGFTDIDFAGGVLGATYTFIFTDGGVATDIDGNGKADTAFREIYYDPSWVWADDGVSNIDVESVALHEAGHALSQAHFGTVRIKKNGSLKASPRAVMNALYSGPLTGLKGTDNGGHCSNWSNWPKS